MKKERFIFFFILFIFIYPHVNLSAKKMPDEQDFVDTILEEVEVKNTPFCFQEDDLADHMELFFQAKDDFYHYTSQGMCVAGRYLIYTRYASDYSETTYVVFDLLTGKEVGHYDFNTLHSNSLTYNPDTNHVVCVTKNHTYIFSFENHELDLIETIYTSINFPKIVYVASEQAYYLATSSKVYSTKDFHQFQYKFSVSDIAVNQGMGFDGKYLYIIWYNVGRNYIYTYDLNGNLHKTYSLISNDYREIEEVDFFGEKMMVSIANSGEKNGIYMVSSQHDYPDWEVQKEATCAVAGYKTKKCTDCDYIKEKVIPLTSKHKLKDWVVTKEVTCTEDGFRYRQCKKCKIKVEKELLKSHGHAWTSWQQIPITPSGEKTVLERSCYICGRWETK